MNRTLKKLCAWIRDSWCKFSVLFSFYVFYLSTGTSWPKKLPYLFFFFFCQSCWELCYPSMFSINRVGSYFFCFNPAVSFSVLLFTTLPQYSMLYFIVNIQKVICNIPLVSVGILSVEGAPENNVHETHYGKEWFTMRC